MRPAELDTTAAKAAKGCGYAELMIEFSLASENYGLGCFS